MNAYLAEQGREKLLSGMNRAVRDFQLCSRYCFSLVSAYSAFACNITSVAGLCYSLCQLDWPLQLSFCFIQGVVTHTLYCSSEISHRSQQQACSLRHYLVVCVRKSNSSVVGSWPSGSPSFTSRDGLGLGESCPRWRKPLSPFFFFPPLLLDKKQHDICWDFTLCAHCMGNIFWFFKSVLPNFILNLNCIFHPGNQSWHKLWTSECKNKPHCCRYLWSSSSLAMFL